MTLEKSSDKPPQPQPLDLPPYLQRTDPLEIEDLPLQVALLTMEAATIRQLLQRMAIVLETAAGMIKLPAIGALDDG